MIAYVCVVLVKIQAVSHKIFFLHHLVEHSLDVWDMMLPQFHVNLKMLDFSSQWCITHCLYKRVSNIYKQTKYITLCKYSHIIYTYKYT